MDEQDITRTEAALASAEIVFAQSHRNYLEASEAFRRASAERDRLAAELTTMRQARAKARAEDEFLFVGI